MYYPLVPMHWRTMQIIIHIGLPKACSTFLQYNVWPLWFPDSAITRRHYWPKAQTPRPMPLLDTYAKEGIVKRETFISNECLSSTWSGFSAFCEVAACISPLPRVVLVIRDHRQWLYSWYLHLYKKKRLRCSFHRWLSTLSDLDYSWESRIRTLCAQFPGRVFVLDVTEINAQPARLFSELAQFCQVECNLHEVLLRVNNPLGHINSTPKTTFGLSIHRVLYGRLLKKFIQLVEKLSKGLIRRESVTVWAIRWADLFAETILRQQGKTAPELPPDVQRYCRKDYENSMQLLRNIRSGITAN